MNENLFVEERRRLIIDRVLQDGRVSVKLLSESLRVSAVTIRQDLRALEEDGILERTHGGAVRKDDRQMPELSFHVRQKRHHAQKEAIAQAAMDLVKEGYSVALDCSSTAFAMIKHLKKLKRLTVVTNSLMAAQGFLDSPHIQVLLPGGRLRRDSISIVGKPEGLPAINFNIGFFGTRGISAMAGATDVDADEVSLKKAMVDHCANVVILADHTKWGEIAPYTFATLDRVERIITDDGVAPAVIEQFRADRVKVEIVSPKSDSK
jgi:DeoR family transcriptional regulator, fructose operon transcriptional repressor